MRRLWMAIGAMAVSTGLAWAQNIEVDTHIGKYTPVQGVSGNIKSIGSDTMNNLMTGWGEEFKKLYPNVKIEIEGKGSGTAPPALIEGQAQFGPMSRPMKAKEIDDFEKKFGYKPVGLESAIDALAIYVHKDCPLDAISFEQAQKVFSVAGGAQDVTWDQLGVTDAAYKGKPVSLYGRNSASGTYGYFKEHVLGGKDYKATVKEQPGSSAVVQGVAADKFGMGYSGLGYKTADVKALKVAAKTDDQPFAPTYEAALSGDYPIARFLYVYVNHDPKAGLDPLRREFVRMVYSAQGQETVIKDGYFPVTAEVARKNLKAVGIEPGF